MRLSYYKKILLIIMVLTIPNCVSAKVFSQRPEVKAFINQMVSKHGFQKKALIDLFNHFESSDEIIQKISRPYEEASWETYRKLFISRKRIEDGVIFWKKYAVVLNKAEKTFGVPAEIIVAILGVETFYGKNTGKYPVLQALATLAFDYPKRAAFFLSELEQYLLLTREQNLPAAKIKGSYAGAMGTPQFISSSYRNFAIDFAEIGKIDIINNVPNAIGSVANYFKMHGWKPKQLIIYKAWVNGQKYKALKVVNKKDPKPTLSLATLKKYNVSPINAKKSSPSTRMAFIQLDSGKKPEFWLGGENFYVITRYNHSVNYAMAVYELSQLIAKEFKGENTNASK
jgi:membrane-bound lytic murein transglycosylase B